MIAEVGPGTMAFVVAVRPGPDRPPVPDPTRRQRLASAFVAPHSPARSAVARFGAAGLLAVLLLGGLVLVAVSRVSTVEALRSARDRARLAGYGIVEPALAPGLTTARSASEPAVADLDELVSTRVLSERVVRVKIWTSDGRILYSDEPRLTGRRFPPPPEHEAILRSGGIRSGLAGSDGAANQFEREAGRLLEVQLPLRTADGQQVVYEQYERYDSVVGNSQRLLRRLAVPLGLGLALLWLTQLPLAHSLARRVTAAEAERRTLLERAVTASERERERIAADLHDGVVQDLAGLTYELAAAAGTLAPGPAQETVERSAAIARAAMRRLRSSLVDLHPEQVHAVGLGAALDELAEGLRRRGVPVSLSVDEDVREADASAISLVYRVAQELLRNVAAHAAASRVDVDVTLAGGRLRLRVGDDGSGFAAATRDERRRDGHVGLDLQEALVRRAGGSLEVRTAPGMGTVVIVEVPIFEVPIFEVPVFEAPR
jgi:two-component system NarL family sensor kinase